MLRINTNVQFGPFLLACAVHVCQCMHCSGQICGLECTIVNVLQIAGRIFIRAKAREYIIVTETCHSSVQVILKPLTSKFTGLRVLEMFYFGVVFLALVLCLFRERNVEI